MRNLLLSLLAVLALAACGSDKTVIKPAHYADLDGWQDDQHAEAFSVFVGSCTATAKRRNAYQSLKEGPIGVRQNWSRACDAAQQLLQPTNAQARRFFEEYFLPYKVETEANAQGTMTGYYEPILKGSYTRGFPYLTPVYGVPSDLKKPYLTRADIVAGKIGKRAPVLLYVEDPVMLFFLHVQGSGKVKLPDGQMVGLQYAAQNGYSYVPIGRILRERGELEVLSMQTIRDWLLSHPDQMNEVMNQNPSYVFFKLAPGDEMAKGALGVPLTPLRSLAVDDDRAAYGVPTWVSTTQSAYLTGQQIPLRRLFISQDTGGALKGPHRGDIFYGRGTVEEWQAGHQNSLADVFWLLPVNPPPELPIIPPVMPPAL